MKSTTIYLFYFIAYIFASICMTAAAQTDNVEIWKKATIHLLTQEEDNLYESRLNNISKELGKIYGYGTPSHSFRYSDSLAKYSRYASGTAFLIESEQYIYILTAKHVIESKNPYKRQYTGIYSQGVKNTIEIEVGATPLILRIPNSVEVQGIENEIRPLSFYDSTNKSSIFFPRTLVNAKAYNGAHVNHRNYFSLKDIDFALIPISKKDYRNDDTKYQTT